jgi:hypothetical protein
MGVTVGKKSGEAGQERHGAQVKKSSATTAKLTEVREDFPRPNIQYLGLDEEIENRHSDRPTRT